MKWSRVGLVIAGATLVISTAQPAAAADPTGLTNISLIAPPATVAAPNGPQSTTEMFVFAEQSNVPPGKVLANDVLIDMTAKVPRAVGGVVRAGTTVRSYYIACTPVPTGPPRTQVVATATFDQPIIGVIRTTTRLGASDVELGAAATVYGGAYAWRGIENADRVTIGADGKTLTIDCDASVTDQVRVLIGVLPKAYVALGDSLSSGEGTGTLGPGGLGRVGYVPTTTVVGTDECHRGNVGVSYPELVNAAGGYNDFRFVACSGARITNLFNNARLGAEVWRNGPQLGAITKPRGGTQVPRRDYFVDLVTFSIGVNDASLADILRACIFTDSATINTQLAPATCAATGNAGVATGVATIARRYPVLLDFIHRNAPVATIRVVGYPNLFGPVVWAPCVIGTRPAPVFGIASFTWANAANTTNATQLAAMVLLHGWQGQVNGAIKTAVAAWATANPTANVKFVDNATTMAPNYMCNNAAAATWSFNGLLFDANNDPMAESVHPNVPGHAALDAAVRATLP